MRSDGSARFRSVRRPTARWIRRPTCTTVGFEVRPARRTGGRKARVHAFEPVGDADPFDGDWVWAHGGQILAGDGAQLLDRGGGKAGRQLNRPKGGRHVLAMLNQPPTSPSGTTSTRSARTVFRYGNGLDGAVTSGKRDGPHSPTRRTSCDWGFPECRSPPVYPGQRGHTTSEQGGARDGPWQGKRKLTQGSNRFKRLPAGHSRDRRG